MAVLTTLAISFAVPGCIALLGPLGTGVGVVVFLVIGNVASGAQVPHEMLPGFWRVVGPWLPPGSAADALRSIAYFGGADLARPLLVLGVFAVVGLTGTLLLGDRKPAAKGAPSGPTPDAS